MIFTEERLNEILSSVERDGKVHVKKLSQKFGVTEDMIRKDLQKLHAAGKVQRTYGGAIAVGRANSESAPLSLRITAGTEAKRSIAQTAYSLLEDNMTIFIDVSSISFLLATLIADNNRNLTIITNMLSIAELFSNNSATNLLFCGGKYHKTIGATIGTAAIAAAADFSFDCSFFGCCGINPKTSGVYNFDMEEGQTKAAFLKSSRRAWLLAETAKFSIDGAYRYARLDAFDGIICEKRPTEQAFTYISKKNINVLVANNYPSI